MGRKRKHVRESQQWVTSPPSTVNPWQVLVVAVTLEGWRQPSASATEPSAPEVASCSSAGSWAQPMVLCHGPHPSPRWGVRPCHPTATQEHNIPSVHQLPQLINCDARCEKAEPDLPEVSWGCRGVKEHTRKQQHSTAQCLPLRAAVLSHTTGLGGCCGQEQPPQGLCGCHSACAHPAQLCTASTLARCVLPRLSPCSLPVLSAWRS